MYLHTIKDKLYCGSKETTKELQKVLLAIYLVMNKLLWPIVPFLIEESWSYFNKNQPFYKTSVNVSPSWRNNEFDSVINLVEKIKAAIKQDSNNVTWRSNVKITANSSTLKTLQVW